MNFFQYFQSDSLWTLQRSYAGPKFQKRIQYKLLYPILISCKSPPILKPTWTWRFLSSISTYFPVVSASYDFKTTDPMMHHWKNKSPEFVWFRMIPKSPMNGCQRLLKIEMIFPRKSPIVSSSSSPVFGVAYFFWHYSVTRYPFCGKKWNQITEFIKIGIFV